MEWRSQFCLDLQSRGITNEAQQFFEVSTAKLDRSNKVWLTEKCWQVRKRFNDYTHAEMEARNTAKNPERGRSERDKEIGYEVIWFEYWYTTSNEDKKERHGSSCSA